MSDFKDWGDNFQTPSNICNYMASFLEGNTGLILEPAAGKGNLVKALEKYGKVVAPTDFNKMEDAAFEWIVMNPPFSPMKQGYDMLFRCMGMSDNIIALMPYLCIINGDKRTQAIMEFGLKSITHLPRSTFKGSRVQTCILEMKFGYEGDAVFKLLPDKKTF